MQMCQSCGMPLGKDMEMAGTNADGSKSDMYCSYCYKDGKFLQPDWTAKDMQDYSMKMIMEKMKMPKFMAWIFTRNVPSLKRWKGN